MGLSLHHNNHQFTIAFRKQLLLIYINKTTTIINSTTDEKISLNPYDVIQRIRARKPRPRAPGCVDLESERRLRRARRYGCCRCRRTMTTKVLKKEPTEPARVPRSKNSSAKRTRRSAPTDGLDGGFIGRKLGWYWCGWYKIYFIFFIIYFCP